ncbi:hypothetical protein DL766_008667 [Monosporascus sp. MC13-8B]|nr:hypothetical protein DL763_008665 [Monosporascus cannonballus]RYP18454.1 hypothetical protein DL766_008667 [Monosporascus sp. MC13-8B]
MGVETSDDKQRAMFVRPKPLGFQAYLAPLQHPDIMEDIKMGTCDWDAVVTAQSVCVAIMERDKKDYAAKGENNPLRRLPRQGETMANTLMPLLDMIPDEMGLRSVRCGLVAIFKDTAETVRQTQAIRETTNENKYLLGRIGKQNHSVLQQLDNNLNKLDEVKQLVHEGRNGNSICVCSSPDDSHPQNISALYAISPEVPMGHNEPFNQPRIMIGELHRCLNVQTPGPTEDIQSVLVQGNRIEEEALGRTRRLLVEPKFIESFAPHQSSFLLVNGHFAGYGYRRTSPLSVFYASLAITMVHTPASVALHFFCGQHIADCDALAGPSGLIRSLILQLLQYPGQPEPSPAFLDADFFGDIVEPGVTVYCIVDNISILEGTGQDAVVVELVDALVAITRDKNARATVKVLLGRENKSTVVVERIPEGNHVALRAAAAQTHPMTLAGIQGGIRSLFLPDAEDAGERCHVRALSHRRRHTGLRHDQHQRIRVFRPGSAGGDGQGSQVNIHTDGHYNSKIYTPGSLVADDVSFKAWKDSPFDYLQIILAGASRERLEALQVPQTAAHMFLRMSMPISESAYPVPRVLDGGLSYSIPFQFITPQHLTMTPCTHTTG